MWLVISVVMLLSIWCKQCIAPSSVENNFLRYMQTNIDPCTDFYGYACGKYAAAHSQIEWDITEIDKFRDSMIEEIQNRLLFQPITDVQSPWMKARLAYEACVVHFDGAEDTTPEFGIVQNSTFPLVLNPGRHFPISWSDVVHLETHYGIPLFMDIKVVPSLVHPQEYIIQLRPAEHVITSLKLDHSKSVARSKFIKFLINRILKKIARVEHDRVPSLQTLSAIASVEEFMIALQTHTTQQHYLSPKGTELTLKELEMWTGFNSKHCLMKWKEYVQKHFTDLSVRISSRTKVTLVDQNNAKQVLYRLLTFCNYMSKNPSTLWNFLLIQIMITLAPDSSLEVRGASERLREQLHLIRPDHNHHNMQDIRKYCVLQVMDHDGIPGYSLAMVSVMHTFAHLKRKAEIIEESVRRQYEGLVKRRKWSTASERCHILDRIKSLRVLYGYTSEELHDPVHLYTLFSHLQVSMDHYDNTRKYRVFKRRYQLSQLTKPWSNPIWPVSPFSTEVLYNSASNQIFFPWLVLVWTLKDNFWIQDYSKFALELARTMAGSLTTNIKKTLWTKTSALASTTNLAFSFADTQFCLINLYAHNTREHFIRRRASAFSVLEEVLCDNIGLKIAYKAFREAASQPQQQQQHPRRGPFPNDKTFFISLAANWCEKEITVPKDHYEFFYGPEYIPKSVRVNRMLANFVHFGGTFHCHSSAQMNLNAKRCSLN